MYMCMCVRVYMRVSSLYMRAARNYRSAMFTASRLLTDEGGAKGSSHEVEEMGRQRGECDDRPVGSTTVSENSTIDAKRERIRVFQRGRQADAIESTTPAYSTPLLFSPVSCVER